MAAQRGMQVLTAGVLIDGQRYHYLGQSNSQLQSRACVMYRCASPADAAALLEQWGCFASINNTAKRAKRIGLLFSTITPIQGLRPIRSAVLHCLLQGRSSWGDACCGCPLAARCQAWHHNCSYQRLRLPASCQVQGNRRCRAGRLHLHRRLRLLQPRAGQAHQSAAGHCLQGRALRAQRAAGGDAFTSVCAVRMLPASSYSLAFLPYFPLTCSASPSIPIPHIRRFASEAARAPCKLQPPWTAPATTCCCGRAWTSSRSLRSTTGQAQAAAAAPMAAVLCWGWLATASPTSLDISTNRQVASPCRAARPVQRLSSTANCVPCRRSAFTFCSTQRSFQLHMQGKTSVFPFLPAP